MADVADSTRPIRVQDDGIREIAGVKGVDRGKPGNVILVRIDESDNAVILRGHYEDVVVTPAQARRLARQLYRLARRVDDRSDAQVPA